jgi:hypothetical protein
MHETNKQLSFKSVYYLFNYMGTRVPIAPLKTWFSEAESSWLVLCYVLTPSSDHQIMQSLKTSKEAKRLAADAKEKGRQTPKVVLPPPDRIGISHGITFPRLLQKVISSTIWAPTHRALVKFQTSPEQSSSVLSALHWSSSSARRTSATQNPTSPARRPTSRAGMVRCDACSKLASTSRTVWPLPVPMVCQSMSSMCPDRVGLPRLYVRKGALTRPAADADSAAMCPRARSTT